MWSGFIRQNEEALRRVQGERLGKDMTKRQKKSLTRIIIAAVLMIILKFLPVEGWLKFVLYMVPYLVVGYDILRKAFKGILNKQVFDENFLMAVATIGAIALGNYKEGVSVMLFYQIGELFQSYAVGKSRRNISDLMDIRPDYANIEKDGELEQVDGSAGSRNDYRRSAGRKSPDRWCDRRRKQYIEYQCTDRGKCSERSGSR